MSIVTSHTTASACCARPGLWLAMAASALMIAGCSGGSGSAPSPTITPTPSASTCVPTDPTTAAECGTLMLNITDADGDFDSYTVDVVSVQLERANGSVFEALPATTRIDFTEYVDLSELVLTASIQPGVYVSGSITLDYSDAEVFVEADGASKAATVVDSSGTPLAQTTVNIRLDERDRLLVTRGRASLMTLDFDLEASHTVDVVPTPAIATAEPFIVAEIDPVDSKDIRLRGLFIEANESDMSYTVAIRPFHRRDGEFGRATVNITDETEFEVDGLPLIGTEGLRALEASGSGTLTVALGTLDVPNREFTATTVLAGSSVPGSELDAIKGNVISRSGDELIIRGGRVYPRGNRPFYFGDITVTVGPDTRVVKAGQDGLLGTDVISVGQNVWVRGDVTTDANAVLLDATSGGIRLNVTRLAGMVNMIVPGQVDIELNSIDRKRVEKFDFTGTGMMPDTDADPDNYEVLTGALLMDSQSVGQPIVVRGFANAFGAAPHDFEGRSVVDYSDVRSSLGVGWGVDGSVAPFVMLDDNGLLLDNQNADIDQRHFIKQGPIKIDLQSLDSNTLIAPRESGRTLFVIKTRDSLQLYADFSDFVAALTNELAGGALARSMYARGSYEGDSNTFSAYKVGVHLLNP